MAATYRIEDIRRVTRNGRQVKLFKAFEKEGSSFVYVGYFSAPARTANRDLWKIVETRGGIGHGAL